MALATHALRFAVPQTLLDTLLCDPVSSCLLPNTLLLRAAQMTKLLLFLFFSLVLFYSRLVCTYCAVEEKPRAVLLRGARLSTSDGSSLGVCVVSSECRRISRTDLAPYKFLVAAVGSEAFLAYALPAAVVLWNLYANDNEELNSRERRPSFHRPMWKRRASETCASSDIRTLS